MWPVRPDYCPGNIQTPLSSQVNIVLKHINFNKLKKGKITWAVVH